MQIDLVAPMWQIFQGLYASGKLTSEAELTDKESTALWEEPPSFADVAGDSYILYSGVYNDTDCIREIEFSSRDAVVELSMTLINEQYEKSALQLDDGHDPWVAVFDAETVDRLATLAQNIEWNEVASAHKKGLEEGIDLLGDGNLHHGAFELETEDFVPYLQALGKFVQSVAKQGRCIAITLG